MAAMTERLFMRLKRIILKIRIKYIGKEKWMPGLEKRQICLGQFFKDVEDDYLLTDLTFRAGGSGVLDYLFLKEIATKYALKNYLEIGTYIGESIACMENVCEKKISITAPPEHPCSMSNYCKLSNMTDFSNRLVGSGVKQYLADSREFDFNIIKENIDLYFIDADHNYDGVYNDTKKVFEHKNEDSFVVWHDFRWESFLFYEEVVQAVVDAIGLEQFGQVYCCDNNKCGIFVPLKYQGDFEKLCSYDKNVLYTYEIKMQMKIR